MIHHSVAKVEWRFDPSIDEPNSWVIKGCRHLARRGRSHCLMRPHHLAVTLDARTQRRTKTDTVRSIRLCTTERNRHDGERIRVGDMTTHGVNCLHSTDVSIHCASIALERHPNASRLPISSITSSRYSKAASALTNRICKAYADPVTRRRPTMIGRG
jgi:hypothetical protein